MSNKISGLHTPPASVGTDRPALKAPEAADGGVPASSAAITVPGDVQITDSAAQLAALMQTLRSQPAVDEARVGQLRSAIEQGSYSVQPRLIADRLIQLEQALAPLPQG
jgi:negative regulator of flagellin synthesis FlgM